MAGGKTRGKDKSRDSSQTRNSNANVDAVAAAVHVVSIENSSGEQIIVLPRENPDGSGLVWKTPDFLSSSHKRNERVTNSSCDADSVEHMMWPRSLRGKVRRVLWVGADSKQSADGSDAENGEPFQSGENLRKRGSLDCRQQRVGGSSSNGDHCADMERSSIDMKSVVVTSEGDAFQLALLRRTCTADGSKDKSSCQTKLTTSVELPAMPSGAFAMNLHTAHLRRSDPPRSSSRNFVSPDDGEDDSNTDELPPHGVKEEHRKDNTSLSNYKIVLFFYNLPAQTEENIEGLANSHCITIYVFDLPSLKVISTCSKRLPDEMWQSLSATKATAVWPTIETFPLLSADHNSFYFASFLASNKTSKESVNNTPPLQIEYDRWLFVAEIEKCLGHAVRIVTVQKLAFPVIPSTASPPQQLRQQSVNMPDDDDNDHSELLTNSDTSSLSFPDDKLCFVSAASGWSELPAAINESCPLPANPSPDGMHPGSLCGHPQLALSWTCGETQFWTLNERNGSRHKANKWKSKRNSDSRRNLELTCVRSYNWSERFGASPLPADSSYGPKRSDTMTDLQIGIFATRHAFIQLRFSKSGSPDNSGVTGVSTIRNISYGTACHCKNMSSPTNANQSTNSEFHLPEMPQSIMAIPITSRCASKMLALSGVAEGNSENGQHLNHLPLMELNCLEPKLVDTFTVVDACRDEAFGQSLLTPFSSSSGAESHDEASPSANNKNIAVLFVMRNGNVHVQLLAALLPPPLLGLLIRQKSERFPLANSTKSSVAAKTGLLKSSVAECFKLSSQESCFLAELRSVSEDCRRATVAAVRLANSNDISPANRYKRSFRKWTDSLMDRVAAPEKKKETERLACQMIQRGTFSSLRAEAEVLLDFVIDFDCTVVGEAISRNLSSEPLTIARLLIANPLAYLPPVVAISPTLHDNFSFVLSRLLSPDVLKFILQECITWLEIHTHLPPSCIATELSDFSSYGQVVSFLNKLLDAACFSLVRDEENDDASATAQEIKTLLERVIRLCDDGLADHFHCQRTHGHVHACLMTERRLLNIHDRDNNFQLVEPSFFSL